MFTTGRIVFVAIFVLVFVAGLIWSYRKEKAVSQVHFKKTYKILLGLVGLLILQFLIVKIRHFLG
jgi:heme/copper-type cytochrome/quinol oxidase subunit 2